MSKHIANQKQRKAFDTLIKAFKACNKAGLVIYAKSENIVAYTKQADHYIEVEHGFEKCLRGMGNQIPCLIARLLADAGADDHPSYVSMEDDKKYNPEGF